MFYPQQMCIHSMYFVHNTSSFKSNINETNIEFILKAYQTKFSGQKHG